MFCTTKPQNILCSVFHITFPRKNKTNKEQTYILINSYKALKEIAIDLFAKLIYSENNNIFDVECNVFGCLTSSITSLPMIEQLLRVLHQKLSIFT